MMNIDLGIPSILLLLSYWIVDWNYNYFCIFILTQISRFCRSKPIIIRERLHLGKFYILWGSIIHFEGLHCWFLNILNFDGVNLYINYNKKCLINLKFHLFLKLNGYPQRIDSISIIWFLFLMNIFFEK